MVNSVRGEIALSLGGCEYCLCLTMGALAEIETALNAASLSQLDERLQNLRSSDLVAILHALLKGGGETLSLEDVRSLPMNVSDVTAAIRTAFLAAGAPGTPDANSAQN